MNPIQYFLNAVTIVLIISFFIDYYIRDGKIPKLNYNNNLIQIMYSGTVFNTKKIFNFLKYLLK